MALDPIKSVQGRAVPVPGSDIDTDRIIPARFMKCVTFDGLGDYLFFDARHQEDGTPKEHPLNEERYQGASVFVSGVNFGCGSSREHAPQALYRAGFRAVIAESFAEIFFGNCATLGIPCVTATSEDIATLGAAIEADPQLEVKVDVEKARVFFGDSNFTVHIPDTAQDALVSGRWDPIAEMLENAEKVDVCLEKMGFASK